MFAKRVAFAACGMAAVSAVGPVQKVIELLGGLKSKVQADQELETEAFTAQEKWCAKTDNDKSHAIEDASNLIAAKAACVEARSALVQEKDSEIQEIAAKVATAERDLQAAEEIRGHEQSLFDEKDKDLSDTIDTLERAILVLKKHGGVGNVEQISLLAAKDSNSVLKKEISMIATGLSAVIQASWVPEQDRSSIEKFLQASSDDANDGLDFENPKAHAYEAHSSGIIDVLEDLRDKAENAQNEARKAEVNSKHAFELLKQSLSDEIKTDKKELDEATAAKHEASEEQANCESVKSATENAKAEDEDYLSQLRNSCKLQEEDYQRNVASRRAEIDAIDKAVEILSSKNTQSAITSLGKSLLQTSRVYSDNSSMRKAAQLLERLGERIHSVALTQVAFKIQSSASEQQDPFGKVKAMIESMITRLENEALQESNHKHWCDEETAETEVKLTKTSDRLAVLDTRIESATAQSAKLKAEIAQLESEIADIDSEQSAATAARHQNKDANTKAITDAESSQQAIRGAITILRKYYSGDASSKNLVQVPKLAGAVKSRDYSANSDSANSIIGILEVAESDFLNMETQTRALEEQQASDYEQLTQKNAVSKATKQAEIRGKTAELSSVENSNSSYASDRTNEQDAYDALTAYRAKLRKSCEYTAPPFEVRAAQRQQEIDGLKQAIQILAGETVIVSPPAASLVQARSTMLRRVARHA